MTMHPFRLIAHRGASVRAPENTLPAFHAARETGSREIETDVQLTTDGALVLCHDATLARYGHGDRRVEECSLAELMDLDFGFWFSPSFAGVRLLLLEDLLESFGTHFIFHIELKGTHPLLPTQTLDLVQRKELENRCIFTSFSPEQLFRARRHSPTARLGWLVPSITSEVLQIARECNLFQICPEAANVTRETVREALEAVAEVRAWGCPRHPLNARETIQKVRNAGCCGITIDEPLWATSPEVQ